MNFQASDEEPSEGWEIDAYRCRNVWRAVILQAIKDIMNCVGVATTLEDPSIYTPDARASASRWIMEGGPRFREVCEMAELEPELVMKRVKGLLDGAKV